jgi:hypothetical protein
MKIKMSFFVKLLFCTCCFIVLPVYGMHNLGTIKVNAEFINFGSDVPKNLTLGSCSCYSPTGKPVAVFTCNNVNGPEVGEKPNKLVMRSGDNEIATITIGQCRQSMPPGLWECNVNISCGRRYACSIDPQGSTTKLDTFSVIIKK